MCVLMHTLLKFLMLYQWSTDGDEHFYLVIIAQIKFSKHSLVNVLHYSI